ncbi:MAG: hypothetical protein ACTHK7_14615 [Aureliella sp.]
MLTKVSHLPPSSERAQSWESLLVAAHFRVLYFGYHRDEFNRLVAEEETANVPETELEEAFVAAAYGEPGWRQLSMNAVLAAAQLMAAAQAMHAACGALGHIAYWSLGLNSTALSLSASKLTLHDVVKHAFGQSRLELERLEQSNEFRYLDAFVNASKHRHLLGAVADLSGDGGHENGGLAILGFRYARGGSECEYPPRCAKQFLGNVCNKIVDQCTTVGTALAHDMV